MTHLLHGDHAVIPAQVALDGELGLHGVGGMTVRLGDGEWTEVVDPGLADDEHEALVAALAAIDTANSLVRDAGN